MSIEPPEIPYNFSDLEPAMSRDSLVFHYLHHERDCFDRLLSMVRGTQLGSLSLDELVRSVARDPKQKMLFHFAAEVWNHDFYWRSMRPRGGGAAGGLVGEHIATRFGSYERFVREFRQASASHIGSGWLWLVWHGGALEIVVTADAGTPLVFGDTPILALDLWEHAYYLDHQNRRTAYVDAFLEELVNWDFANRMLSGVAASEALPVHARTVSEADRARPSAL